MPHLTLIGGPVPQPRAACAAKFTAPVLMFGGVPYVRDDKSTPDDMIYVAAGHCEHEWGSWFLIRHKTRPSEFVRVCVKCPEQEREAFSLPVQNTEPVPDDADLTRVYVPEGDMTWIDETGWPTGMLSAARLPVESV